MKLANKCSYEKSCHSRTSLSGIYNARRCQIKEISLLNGYVEDPRQKPSGMTPYLMSGSHLNCKGEALNKGSFRDPLRSGFTLIELLVVVLIIGILAAVALPQYRVAVAKSRYAKLKHMVRALVEAEEVYYLANGDYTTNMNELDVEISNGTVNTQWEYHGDSSKQYLYNFGSCQLVNSIDDKRVMCVDNEINMGYREYLHHSPNYAGQRRCDVRGSTDDTDWRLSICKMETNNGAREGNASASVKTWTY